MKHKVIVWGKPLEIDVEQQSKTVWIASGTYLGEHLQVKDSSKGSAVTAWQKAATYKGN